MRVFILTILALAMAPILMAQTDDLLEPDMKLQTKADQIVNKAILEYQKSELKARKDLLAALDKALEDRMSAKDLDGAVAIKLAKEKAQKGVVLLKLDDSGKIAKQDENPWLGKWDTSRAGLYWEFTPDGKAAKVGEGWIGKWVVKGDSFEVTWDRGIVETFSKPDSSGVLRGTAGSVIRRLKEDK